MKRSVALEAAVAASLPARAILRDIRSSTTYSNIHGV